MSKPTKLQNTVTERVRAVMAARKLGQADVAGSLGMSQGALSRRLTGSVAFNIADIEQFAFITGYDPGVFFAKSFDLEPTSEAA